MTVKEYFAESTLSQMKKASLVRFQTKRNLVDRIEDLDELETGVIAVRMIPSICMAHAKTEEEGAKTWQKYEFYLEINQPENERQARSFTDIPLTSRKKALEIVQENCKGHFEEYPLLGFSYHGITKEDGRARRVGLVSVGKAHRILSYAKSIREPIVKNIYANQRTEEAGATILCSVPSRRKGVGDYQIKMQGVPFFNGTSKRVLAWNTQTNFLGNAPLSDLGNIRLSRDNTHPAFASCQEVAAYMAIIENQLANHNFTPLEMNPYTLFSKSQSHFAVKIANQVLVQDTTQGGKLRKLYEAEQSWLLMQRALRKGHDSTLYWDPVRDGNMSDYNLTKDRLFALAQHI